MKHFSKVKILVCESNPMVFKTIEGALGLEKFEFTCADDGRRGLEFLKRGDCDVLLTEILLPFFSGMELLHFVRSKLNSTIPILVLSIINRPDTIELAYQLGATDFIEKPFAPEHIKARVLNALHQQERGLQTYKVEAQI